MEFNNLKLEDLATFKYGKMPNSKKKSIGGPYPIYTGYKISGYYPEYMYEDEMLIIVARGVGGTGDVKIAPPKCYITNLAIILELDKANCDYKYMQLYLQSLNLRYLDSGSAQSQITINDLKRLKVSIPDLTSQQKIAKRISNIEEKITNNNNIIHTLEQLSQTIFKHWFIDFEFPNEEGKPYKSSGGEMVVSELGEIPKKWSSKKFNSIMKISSGKRPKIKAENYSLEDSIPIIGASKIMGYTRDVLFDSPILVIGRVGTHGVVQKIVDRCWPSDNTLVIQSEFYNFVYEFLKVIDYKSLNRGSTQPLITQTDIKNQTIIVPEDLEIMKKFEETLMPLLNKQSLLLKENESLTQLRDTLLPKLLSGEIEIPDELEV